MGISSKITETELESPTGVSMILDCENCIRAVFHCTEANNKYMYNYDESKENSYFSMPILTIKTNGIYQNHFFLVDLKMLKISKNINLKKHKHKV